LSHQTTSTISAPFNEEIANPRFNHWCKVSASGDWDKFYKRLEWNGWERDAVLRVLGTELEPETYSLPSWALTLAEIIETVAQLTQENLEPLPRDSNDPKPFEDVFLPLVLVGRQKLLARLGVE
ncbi:MAG: hypothetical protein ACKPGT_23005, partial [Microcystis sp.]